MIVRNDLGAQVKTAIQSAQVAGDLPAFDIPKVVIERPRESGRGDYACPMAMQLARLARMAPIKIAEAIVQHLPAPDYVDAVDVAPPGFINFKLTTAFLQRQVDDILALDDAYGSFDRGKGKKAQVEFVSANPTGPLTIGRGRGGVMGDTLARALEAAGYDVTREYYFNDAGRQMVMLGESLKVRCQQLLGQQVDLGEEHYQGEYLYWIAAVLVGSQGDALLDNPVEWFTIQAKDAITASIRSTLRRLKIAFDVYYNEHDLYTSGRVWEALDALKQNGYAAIGAGKIFHHGGTGTDRADNPSFDSFYRLQIHANKPPVNYNGYVRGRDHGGLAGPSYDWGEHDVPKQTDEYTVEYVNNVMATHPKNRPLFLAAGIFRPHLPFWAPPNTFTRYPFDKVRMPPMPEGY